VSRALPSAAVLAASALALLAPGAAAQDPTAMVDAMPQVAANPPSSAISEQYREIASAVNEALPEAPVAQTAPAPAPKPAPAAPAPEPQYHSESPASVTVTQTQPTNVNVSIRINSPGDDGPVTQINNAGGSSSGGGGGASPPADPAPPAQTAPPPAADEPDVWEWTWTSACFGGSPGATAASMPTVWRWNWSCDLPDPGDVIVPGPDILPNLPADEFASAGVLPPGIPVLREERPAPRRAPAPPRHPVRHTAVPPPAASAPVQASGGSLAGSVVRLPAAAAAHAGRAVRHAAEATARDLDTGSLLLPPGTGGLSAGPATGGLSAAMTLLLGVWIATLVSGLGLVLPRLWWRRWSGPPWRLSQGGASRLERPG
jgi:hypothetical protein